MKDALESIPCEVYSVDELGHKDIEWLYPTVKVLTRDNVHEWARENGGPIEITDEMLYAGFRAAPDHLGINPSDVRTIYAAMEAKRREGQ